MLNLGVICDNPGVIRGSPVSSVRVHGVICGSLVSSVRARMSSVRNPLSPARLVLSKWRLSATLTLTASQGKTAPPLSASAAYRAVGSETSLGGGGRAIAARVSIKTSPPSVADRSSYRWTVVRTYLVSIIPSIIFIID